MTTEPTTELYWDEQAFEEESRRIYEVCHGCRLCATICPAFPRLFEITDAVDGDLERLSSADYKDVVDLCYQCKLCYVRCPYTPPHRYQLDFPRLMLRAKALYVRRHGMKLQDRIMGDTDRLGALGGIAAPMSNWPSRMGPARFVMEKTLGVHRRRLMPRFHRQSFAAWFRKRTPPALETGEKKGKVALFYTCYVNYNDPEVGKAAVEVLERNGLEVICPEQQCCGMPFLDGGDIEPAMKKARFNLESLGAAVGDGLDVVVPGPTCSYMLKHEYPVLLGDDAKAVSTRTFDLSEYLMRLHEQGGLDTSFAGGPGKVVYHLPCHLLAQNIGFQSRDLMALIPGTEVDMVERCSGHDGTWGVKKEYFDLSMRVGRRLFEDVEGAQPAVAATDCPLAAMQIEQGTGVKPVHPVQVLQAAYSPQEVKGD